MDTGRTNTSLYEKHLSNKKIRELSDKMIVEFQRGGVVSLDGYTPEEIKEARRIYNNRTKK